MNGYDKTFKYLDKCTGGFYSPRRICTYGRPWMFITGSRSVGKSTSIAILCILDYLVNGHKWIYCRRTKDEVQLTAPTFFGNAIAIINKNTNFKIHEVVYSKQKFYISMEDDKIEGDEEEGYERHECGMIIPLSLEQKYKSSNLSEYFTIIYDEFIAKNSSQYLGTKDTPEREYKSMLSLYQTVDRGIDKPFRNETSVFFLGNTATVYNPIFLSVGIADYVTPTAKIIAPRGKLWILEQVGTVEALSSIQDSYAYQLANEEERAYAYENKGLEAIDETFIGEPGICHYDETFTLGGIDYGICHDDDWVYYVGKPRYKVTTKKYSLDVSSHNGIDLKLIHKMMEHPMTMWLHDAYLQGRLYFNNARTKQEWMRYLKFIPK